MNDNTILEIAQRYAAHADSTLSIRGNADILAFVREVFTVQQQAGESPLGRPPFVKRVLPVEWKAGDLCRYAGGSTALVKLISPHIPAHGWHGTQCMGRTIFVRTEDLIPASHEERLNWVDCAMRWRKKSKAEAYGEAGLPVPILDEFDVTSDPAKIHEVFEHDQQCDDMAGVPHIPT